MSDPATLVQRVQRRLRRHLQAHPRSPLRVLRRPVLNTRARRERAMYGCPPTCPCADTMPACRRWEGGEQWPSGRCARCGAAREHHDDQAVTT